MLVLTRRVGEKLVIGNEIVVEVLSISGEGVRLGIVAPKETSVHRFEVFKEIQAANQAASTPTVSRAIVKDLAASVRKDEKKGDSKQEKSED
jgi:carbon storage regulator